MEQKRLRLGIAGLGRAFSLMLPTLAGDARIHMVAGADPRAEARAQFERDFAGRGFECHAGAEETGERDLAARGRADLPVGAGNDTKRALVWRDAIPGDWP